MITQLLSSWLATVFFTVLISALFASELRSQTKVIPGKEKPKTSSTVMSTTTSQVFSGVESSACTAPSYFSSFTFNTLGTPQASGRLPDRPSKDDVDFYYEECRSSSLFPVLRYYVEDDEGNLKNAYSIPAVNRDKLRAEKPLPVKDKLVAYLYFQGMNLRICDIVDGEDRVSRVVYWFNGKPAWQEAYRDNEIRVRIIFRSETDDKPALVEQFSSDGSFKTRSYLWEKSRPIFATTIRDIDHKIIEQSRWTKANEYVVDYSVPHLQTAPGEKEKGVKPGTKDAIEQWHRVALSKINLLDSILTPKLEKLELDFPRLKDTATRKVLLRKDELPEDDSGEKSKKGDKSKKKTTEPAPAKKSK